MKYKGFWVKLMKILDKCPLIYIMQYVDVLLRNNNSYNDKRLKKRRHLPYEFAQTPLCKKINKGVIKKH